MAMYSIGGFKGWMENKINRFQQEMKAELRMMLKTAEDNTLHTDYTAENGVHITDIMLAGDFIYFCGDGYSLFLHQLTTEDIKGAVLAIKE